MKDAQGTVLRQSLALYNKLLIRGMRLAMLLALEEVLEATREITLAVDAGVSSGQIQCSPRNYHHVPHTALSTSSQTHWGVLSPGATHRPALILWGERVPWTKLRDLTPWCAEQGWEEIIPEDLAVRPQNPTPF